MKKTLRSVILLVLALSMLLALTACSTSQKSDKVKIGVTLMDFSTEFGIGLKDYMTAKADAMGDVELTVVDAGGDAAKQLQQVETFISQKVDAIIMQPRHRQGQGRRYPHHQLQLPDHHRAGRLRRQQRQRVR